MITSTQGMRLKHSLELVAHFANLDHENAEQEAMERDETVTLLRACITSILGKPRFEVAVQFAEFRQALAERAIKAEDGDVQAVLSSPYFFIRTTLSALLALAKGTKGATTEHALGNTALLIPLLWNHLRAPEKWQVGQVYAEVNSNGNSEAATAIKMALLKVQGFDFVPETLRSSTFTEAAARVLAAHFAFNNFYKEEEPMAILANLGSAIPKPAFAKSMEATLAVALGNPWGNSFAALPYAKQILDHLRPEQWEYYLNECLQRDRTVLDKLAFDNKPLIRWMKFTADYELFKLKISERVVRIFIEACDSQSRTKAQQQAEAMRSAITA